MVVLVDFCVEIFHICLLEIQRWVYINLHTSVCRQPEGFCSTTSNLQHVHEQIEDRLKVWNTIDQVFKRIVDKMYDAAIMNSLRGHRLGRHRIPYDPSKAAAI